MRAAACTVQSTLVARDSRWSPLTARGSGPHSILCSLAQGLAAQLGSLAQGEGRGFSAAMVRLRAARRAGELAAW